MLDDGVGIALDGCVWVFMGDESFSQESLNSKLLFYLLSNLHLPLNLSVSDDRKFLYNWHPPLAAKMMAKM